MMPSSLCAFMGAPGACDDFETPQVCADGSWSCPPGSVPSSTCVTFGDAGPAPFDAGYADDCGGALTVACNPTTDACMSYTTTCVDAGYVACNASTYATHAGLEALCRSYCTVDGGARDAACESVVSP
jgi:hypothetical protein